MKNYLDAFPRKRRIYLMDLDNPSIPIIRTLKDPRDAGRDITSAKFNSRGALASTVSTFHDDQDYQLNSFSSVQSI